MIEEHLNEYGSALRGIMKTLADDMLVINEDSEQYKDAQYFLELVDIIYGSTDLIGSGFDAREKDLNAVRNSINKLEVME